MIPWYHLWRNCAFKICTIYMFIKSIYQSASKLCMLGVCLLFKLRVPFSYVLLLLLIDFNGILQGSKTSSIFHLTTHYLQNINHTNFVVNLQMTHHFDYTSTRQGLLRIHPSVNLQLSPTAANQSQISADLDFFFMWPQGCIALWLIYQHLQQCTTHTCWLHVIQMKKVSTIRSSVCNLLFSRNIWCDFKCHRNIGKYYFVEKDEWAISETC